MKKRVCIVKLGYYPWQPPLKRDAETLVSHGYQVDLLCLRNKGEKARETIGGVNVYRLPGEHYRKGVLRYVFEYSYFFIAASLALSWLSLKERYDVIEVDTMPDFLVFATLFPRLLGARVILYMFENMPQLFASTYQISDGHISAKLMRLVEKESARYAHHVIVADGIPYKRVLESRGVPSEKITIVLNVPNSLSFNLDSFDTTKDGNHFRLIVTTTLTERYGVQTVIKAIPFLLSIIPELQVDVTGTGEYQPELERLARDIGVKEYVNFTGVIPYEELILKIAQAHVGIAPMLYDIGVSTKLFGYAATRTASVASALPSLTATFSDDCVLYYPPGDERALANRILELYHSPQKRASLAARANEFYRNCQWEIMKYEYLKVYEECMASKLSSRQKKGVAK